MSSDKVDHLSDCEISEVTETKVTATPEDAARMMLSIHGPQAVDQALRSAVSLCWMMLPDDRRSAGAVEHEVRRILDRVIADLQEDAKVFGK
jgi:hypothetical protein